MRNIFPNNNLPVPSQQWGREVQKRLELLESNFSLQKTNTSTVDGQLQSSYKRLDETVRNLDRVDVDVAQITAIADNAINTANTSLAGLNSLAAVDSIYTVNGDNITSTFLPAEPILISQTASSAGYTGAPQVILNTGGLTLSKSHAGKHVLVTGNGQTITIPSNASVPFEIGTIIVVINADVTSSIAITSNTLRLAGTVSTGTRTLGAWGVATLVKVEATTWIVYGNGLS